jgi:hypothetical protein
MIVDIMKQSEYSCYNSISNWLNVHFQYTTLTSLILSIFVMLIHPAKLFYSGWPFGYHEHFSEGPVTARIRRLLIFILIELALMITYIFAAFVVTWTLNLGPITRMTFNRWLIEACYAPMISEISIFILYRTIFFGSYVISTVAYHVQFACLLKLTLFLFTRYREFYTSSSLNGREIEIFHRICNRSTQNYTSDFKPLEFSYYHFWSFVSY